MKRNIEGKRMSAENVVLPSAPAPEPASAKAGGAAAAPPAGG